MKSINGKLVDVQKGTFGKICINRNDKLYYEYMRLRSDDKLILDAMLMLMHTDMNHITMLGDTLEEVSKKTSCKVKAIRDGLTRLKKTNLIEKLQLEGEFLINPVFAYKGIINSVWLFIQYLHYNGQVPRSVQGWIFDNDTINSGVPNWNDRRLPVKQLNKLTVFNAISLEDTRI